MAQTFSDRLAVDFYSSVVYSSVVRLCSFSHPHPPQSGGKLLYDQNDLDACIGRVSHSKAAATYASVLLLYPIWNSLPDSVISAPSLSSFHQRIETFLFQASFPDIITDPR